LARIASGIAPNQRRVPRGKRRFVAIEGYDFAGGGIITREKESRLASVHSLTCRGSMKKFYLLPLGLLALFLLCPGTGTMAQEGESRILVIVNMVQLNVAVTDNKGNYITGLRPQDFAVLEDGIPERIATFGEGNELTRSLLEVADDKPTPQGGDRPSPRPDPPPETFASAIAGANVFILFDTSNYMYRHFVFAQDAIADFVRTLEPANKIAFYSYSRDLSRVARLTPDRSQVLRGVRATVAGEKWWWYFPTDRTMPAPCLQRMSQSWVNRAECPFTWSVPSKPSWILSPPRYLRG